MKKSDKIIMLAVLYNKISDLNSSEAMIEETFFKKGKELVSEGYVDENIFEDFCFIMFQDKRERFIKNLKSEIKKELKKEKQVLGYSKEVNVKKVNSVIDKVLEAETLTNKRGYGSYIDHCSRSSRTSSC